MCLYPHVSIFFPNFSQISSATLEFEVESIRDFFFNGSLSDGISVASSLTSSLLGSGLTSSVLGSGLISRLFVIIVLVGFNYGWDNSNIGLAEVVSEETYLLEIGTW